MKGHADLGGLLKVSLAGVAGTISPYFAALIDGDVVGWISAFLKIGVPFLVFIYTASKIYFLWKNNGRE